jgi:hypothetical protein
MDSVGLKEFKATVCDQPRCWQIDPPKESNITANCGEGWCYFRAEKHFKNEQCVGRGNKVDKMCDAVAVPRQSNCLRIIFIELKTSGKYSSAVTQIRSAVETLLGYDLPANVALMGEIWFKREPKSPIRDRRVITVAGRQVSIRHRRSS